MSHPILIQFGSLTLYTYGLFVAAASIVAFIFSTHLAIVKKVPARVVSDLILVFFVTGIIGSRLFYVFQNMDYFMGHPGQVAQLNQGGLVWYGGFLTAAICGVVYALIFKHPIVFLCDLFAPVLALAHGVGRLGCFFNGCCYGVTTNTFLDVDFGLYLGKHLPTQLYEAFFLFFLAYYLYRYFLSTPVQGKVFFRYVLAYAIFRFGIEFYRENVMIAAGLTAAQWTSLVLAGFAFVWRLKVTRHH